MTLLSEKQKTKLFSDSGIDELNIDCYIKKVFENKLLLGLGENQPDNFSDLIMGDYVDIRVFTPNGIVIFKSTIIKILSDREIEISYDENNLKIENTRQNPRYETNCPITIFRPLKGNIDSYLIDISVRGLRFYSEIPLETDSVFEIMLYLSDTIGKIILTGKILDKNGLPEGVHRMLIEEISYTDRQKLVDYCMSLAK